MASQPLPRVFPQGPDLRTETPLALADVPNYLPKRHGKKAHYSTIFRWVTKGARGRVLESKLVGGVRYTTVEAVNRFLNVDGNAPAALPGDDLDSVDQALEAAGL